MFALQFQLSNLLLQGEDFLLKIEIAFLLLQHRELLLQHLCRAVNRLERGWKGGGVA